MNEIQEHLLQIMVDLDDFLTKNEIDYVMHGGTLLGAARHKGFIPWDDDIDIGMTRENFNRFLAIADKLPEKYRLRYSGYGDTDENYPYLFGKVEDTTTELIENSIAHLGIKSGLYVDVMVFDGIPDNGLLRVIHILRFEFWLHIKMLLVMDAKINRGMAKRFIIKIVQFFFSIKSVVIRLEKIIEKYPIDTCSKCSALSEFYRKIDYVVGTDDFFGGTERCMFEGHMFRCAKNSGRVLRAIYGDWKKLPPKEERIPRHDFSLKFK